MTAIAIIGADRHLSETVARRFGREGSSQVLISRNRERLDEPIHVASFESLSPSSSNSLAARSWRSDPREDMVLM